jgi:hypothetical protein
MPLYTLLQNLLNVMVQVANKMGIQTKYTLPSKYMDNRSLIQTNKQTNSMEVVISAKKNTTFLSAD